MRSAHTLFVPLLAIVSATACANSAPKGSIAQRPAHVQCDSLLALSAGMLAKDPTRALSLAQDAWILAEATEDKQLELRVSRTIAATELRMGMSIEFMRSALLSLDIATALGDPEQIALALKDVSLAYGRNMRADQAVVEARKALTITLALPDAQAKKEAHQFLMRTLLKAGKHSEALSAGIPALQNCVALDDEICHARVHQLIAQVLIAMQKPADALPYLTKAERVLLENGEQLDRFQLAMDRSRSFLELGMTNKAEETLSKAIEALPTVADPDRKASLLALQYDLAMAKEEWQSALSFLQRIKAQDDSLDQARSDMQMAGLQVLHEIKAKEQDNAILRDVNAQQAETIAGQRTSNRYLMILLAGVIILTVALFITSRYTLRMMRRLGRKNQVIRRQHDEIQGKVLELKRQNLRLAESLMSEEEKELILKEIHHRVKNNLQVVDSLLNIQGNGEDDPRLQRLLKDAQGRIRSMAMVHEHIYRSSGDMHASLRSHLEKLGRSVLVAHGSHDRISIQVDTDLPTFPEETMLPLSLMVNELLTNSLKHAFTGLDGGSIRISVKTLDPGFELRYADDGVGIGHLGSIRQNGSFGHELISILAHQLNGELQVDPNVGAALRMTFTPDKTVLRKAV